MSACESETTVPGILKRLVDPTSTDSAVCCSATQCTKTFASKEVFARELGIYQKNLPYVPRLISHDRRTRTIVTERVGTPLGTVWDSGVTVIGSLLNTTSRCRLLNARIRKLHKQFRRDTGLYHNDLLYKNVLRDGKRLYLVDFERCGATLTDADTDGILSRRRRRVVWLVVVILVIVRLLVGMWM
jgi:hypothetical protein